MKSYCRYLLQQYLNKCCKQTLKKQTFYETFLDKQIFFFFSFVEKIIYFFSKCVVSKKIVCNESKIIFVKAKAELGFEFLIHLKIAKNKSFRFDLLFLSILNIYKFIK